jgi:hypothetical protein
MPGHHKKRNLPENEQRQGAHRQLVYSLGLLCQPRLQLLARRGHARVLVRVGRLQHSAGRGGHSGGVGVRGRLGLREAGWGMGLQVKSWNSTKDLGNCSKCKRGPVRATSWASCWHGIQEGMIF